MMMNSLAKEAQCGGSGQLKVDDLTCSIYRVVQIFPLSFDFYVGFIHMPSTAHCVFMLTKHLIQQRHQADNPAVKCGVADLNAALRDHLFEITQTQ